jgi:hypothetical protein
VFNTIVILFSDLHHTGQYRSSISEGHQLKIGEAHQLKIGDGFCSYCNQSFDNVITLLITLCLNSVDRVETKSDKQCDNIVKGLGRLHSKYTSGNGS